MPKYTPIPHPKIRCSLSDLIELHWLNNTPGQNSIDADFVIPDDSSHALRVHFRNLQVLRLLDEMPISTENEETANDGLISDNFAYIVEDASFLRHQSWALKTVMPGLKHYRFITGWTCMDVLSKDEPEFSIVTCKPSR